LSSTECTISCSIYFNYTNIDFTIEADASNRYTRSQFIALSTVSYRNESTKIVIIENKKFASSNCYTLKGIQQKKQKFFFLVIVFPPKKPISKCNHAISTSIFLGYEKQTEMQSRFCQKKASLIKWL